MQSRVKGLNQTFLSTRPSCQLDSCQTEESELKVIGKRHKKRGVSGTVREHWLLPFKEQVRKAIFFVPLLYYHQLASEKGH